MKSDELARVRRTLWAAADELRANSTLSPAEYRGPVLGLIFLAYAEHRFEQVRPELEAKATARDRLPRTTTARGRCCSSRPAPGCRTWSTCPKARTWARPSTRR